MALLSLGSSLNPLLADDVFRSECGYLGNALSFERQSAQIGSHVGVHVGPNQYYLNSRQTAWAGYYFPFEKGGITARWQLPNKPHRYALLSESADWHGAESLRILPRNQLNTLSPVEKFDIVSRQYDFPATKVERENRSSFRNPEPEDWEGFCNGRCAAAINLPEPKGSIFVRNGDGIILEFAPNDLKALGAASYFYVEKYAQLGIPSDATNQRKLRDPPHPAVLDMALRGYLAKQHKGFVIDDHKGSEIWNVTVVGYDRKLGDVLPFNRNEARYAPEQTAYQVDVTTDVRIVGEPSLDQLTVMTGPNIAGGGDLTESRRWTYRLFLDGDQQIIGGRYLRNRGPDFAWFASGDGMESAYGANSHLRFELIKKLFERAQKPLSVRRTPMRLTLD